MPTACSQCATELADHATACAHCGSAVMPAAPPASQSAEAVALYPLTSTFSFNSDLRGIGGWLILVAWGLAIAPLRSLHGIYATLHVLYGGRFQHLFSARPGFAGLILYEAVTNSFFLVYLIALNYLFYRKKKLFPGLMVTFLVVEVVLIVVDHLVTMHFSTRTNPIHVLATLFAAAIWISYFLVSARVKATFVN